MNTLTPQILALGIASLFCAACGQIPSPTSADVAKALSHKAHYKTNYQADQVKNLSCSMTGDGLFECDFVLESAHHTDVLRRSAIGTWKIVKDNTVTEEKN